MRSKLTGMVVTVAGTAACGVGLACFGGLIGFTAGWAARAREERELRREIDREIDRSRPAQSQDAIPVAALERVVKTLSEEMREVFAQGRTPEHRVEKEMAPPDSPHEPQYDAPPWADWGEGWSADPYENLAPDLDRDGAVSVPSADGAVANLFRPDLSGENLP